MAKPPPSTASSSGGTDCLAHGGDHHGQTSTGGKLWSWERLKSKAVANARLCRAKPHVVIVPVVVAGLMMGLGVWAVLQGAEAQADSQRREAQSQVDAAASSLQLTIERAIQPVVRVADWVKHRRTYSVIRDTWQERLDDWVDEGYYLRVTLAPQGWFEFAYPVGSYPNFTWDGLRAGSPYRSQILNSLQAGGITVTGPSTVNGTIPYSLGLQIPVFIANVSENETWGIPYNATDCPPGLCYNSTTRTKWWGQAATTAPFLPFITKSGPLASIMGIYHWQLWRPDRVRSSTRKVVVDPNNVVKPQPDDAIKGTVNVAGELWDLYVWKDNWEPDWKVPLMITVVIVSLVVGVLLFAVLISWVEHHMLLRSLLPKATISRLREEAVWHDGKGNQHVLDMVEIETPAQQMLSVLRSNMEGRVAPMALVLSVQRALQQSVDVYRPPSNELKARLAATNMDEESRVMLAQALGQSPSILWGGGSGHVSAKQGKGGDGEDHDRASLADSMDVATILERLITQPALHAGGTPSSPGGLNALQDLRLTSSGRMIPAAKDDPTLGWQPERRFSMPGGGSASGPASANGAGGLLSRMRKASRRHPEDPPLSAVIKANGSSLAPELPAPPVLVVTGDAGGADSPVSAERDSVDLHLPCPPVAMRVVSLQQQAPAAAPHVDKPIMEEVDRILALAATSWEFDSYALEEATQGHPLSVLGFWLMTTSGCVQYAGMSPTTLARFLRRVEAGYPSSNPYHNARHAADVLQTMHVILHQGGLAPHYADQHTVLSCYLAAVIHDFEHRGLSNDFVVNAGDKVALLYNDKSPMENHHLAAAWALLTQPQFNILSGLSKEAVTRLRKLVIELVLSTDIKQHFSIMGQFSAQHSLEAEKRGADDAKGQAPPALLKARLSATPWEPPKPVNDGERLLCLQMAIKCADMGHMSEPLPVHIRWLQDLEQEFFMQGDIERERGLPISPLCDRTKEGVTKSQIGFFDFVCKPLFLHFTARFKGAQPLLTGLLDNYAYWVARAAEAAAQQATQPST